MNNKPDCQQLIYQLKSLLAILKIAPNSTLYKDTLTVCNFLEKNIFRIAVFAPFNHGKSTLLNALLGQKTLPIDLIPTTGAAISMRYGTELITKITLKNGKIITEKGTDILKQYAILDAQRRMNDDVASVEVFCDDPFLKAGIEFIDLPGTNDQEEQNNLVKEKLLGVDLIIHVLDARKLMTLEERENLRDWLLDRGIDNVLFVVNFLNLLEPEEQKQVQNRLIFVAESFRSRLPQGVSNLYRVDALPALRARLKGDSAATRAAGLTTLETALQTIFQYRQKNSDLSLDRIKKITAQLQQLAETKKYAILAVIEAENQKQQSKQALQNKAKKLILEGLQRSISEMESWLYPSNLFPRYQTELIEALKQNKFDIWVSRELRMKLDRQQDIISEWEQKGSDFFSNYTPDRLKIELPPSPAIKRSETKVKPKKEESQERKESRSSLFQTVDQVVNKVIGVTLSEGIDYIFERKDDQTEVVVPNTDNSSDDRVYIKAAEVYLQNVSKTSCFQLKRYQHKVEKKLEFTSQQNITNNSTNEHQIQLIDSLLSQLQQELIDLEPRIR
jgi:GTPase SAR1 family protein